MTIQDAVVALRRFNIWRRYDGPAGCAPKMPDMKVIGEAVDVVCDYVDHRLVNPKHFKLEELLKSPKALEKKIGNYPSWEDVENLRDLAFDLDNIREDVNAPVNATSGFRCKKLNSLVGGVDSSAHLMGNAADLQCPSLGFNEFTKAVEVSVKRRGMKFDQLIIEREVSSGKKWIHYGRKNNSGLQRCQIKLLEV